MPWNFHKVCTSLLDTCRAPIFFKPSCNPLRLHCHFDHAEWYPNRKRVATLVEGNKFVEDTVDEENPAIDFVAEFSVVYSFHHPNCLSPCYLHFIWFWPQRGIEEDLQPPSDPTLQMECSWLGKIKGLLLLLLLLLPLQTYTSHTLVVYCDFWMHHRRHCKLLCHAVNAIIFLLCYHMF